MKKERKISEELIEEIVEDIRYGAGWAELDYITSIMLGEYEHIHVSGKEVKEAFEDAGYHFNNYEGFYVLNLSGIDEDEIREELELDDEK